jgi:DNA replication protein DnaC
LSLRTGKKSTIITSNLAFEIWDEIFNNTTLRAVLVDRLTHKTCLVNMNGDSYRLRETKEMVKK